MSARRGEVWLARFDPIEGREQAGVRPALVLSVDSFNASRADLVAVLPITSKPRPGTPFRIEVQSPEGAEHWSLLSRPRAKARGSQRSAVQMRPIVSRRGA